MERLPATSDSVLNDRLTLLFPMADIRLLEAEILNERRHRNTVLMTLRDDNVTQKFEMSRDMLLGTTSEVLRELIMGDFCEAVAACCRKEVDEGEVI